MARLRKKVTDQAGPSYGPQAPAMPPAQSAAPSAQAAPPASPLGPPLLTGDLQSKIGQLSGGGLVSQQNPYLRQRIGEGQQNLIDQFKRQVLPSLSQAAEGAGRFGSDAYQTAQGQAATGLAQALRGVESDMGFADYNARMQDMLQGLGIGAGMYGTDVGAQTQRYGTDVGAQVQREGYQNQAQMQQAQLQAEQQMQMEDLQFKAAQAAQQGDFQTMQMMLQAANQLGAQQANALGNLPAIEDMGGTGFLQDLLSQSTGLDTAAINAMLGQGQLGIAQGQLGLANKQLGLDQQQQQFLQQLGYLNFANQNPWDQLNNFANIINAMTGGFGTTSSQGHQTTPYMGPSPWGAAISGAMGGATMGLGLGNLFGGNRAGQPPPGYNPTYRF